MASTLETIIKTLLYEAGLNDSERNISKLKDAITSIRKAPSYSLRTPPESLWLVGTHFNYKVTFEEEGLPPALPSKYLDRIMNLSVKEKLLKKFNGCSRATVIITCGEFSCWFTVHITYTPRFDCDQLIFSHIKLNITSGVNGTADYPLKAIVEEAYNSVYVCCSHSAKFACIEYPTLLKRIIRNLRLMS